MDNHFVHNTIVLPPQGRVTKSVQVPSFCLSECDENKKVFCFKIKIQILLKMASTQERKKKKKAKGKLKCSERKEEDTFKTYETATISGNHESFRVVLNARRDDEMKVLNNKLEKTPGMTFEGWKMTTDAYLCSNDVEWRVNKTIKNLNIDGETDEDEYNMIYYDPLHALHQISFHYEHDPAAPFKLLHVRGHKLVQFDENGFVATDVEVLSEVTDEGRLKTMLSGIIIVHLWMPWNGSEYQIWSVWYNGKEAEIKQCDDDKKHPNGLAVQRSMYPQFEIQCEDDIILPIQKTCRDVQNLLKTVAMQSPNQLLPTLVTEHILQHPKRHKPDAKERSVLKKLQTTADKLSEARRVVHELEEQVQKITNEYIARKQK